MTWHTLKTHPEPFQAILEGRKRFEFRRNDRNFGVSDCLRLMEWNPATQEYTGREYNAQVLYIVRGPSFGVPEGFCIMSIIEAGPS